MATKTTIGAAEKMPGCVWTNESVTLLLSLYLREQQLDRPQKQKKKDVWRGICSELWSRGLVCSWQECDKKYRNLKQTFVRNLKQAGKKECRWIFFPLMLEINKHEPFVNEVVGSVLAQPRSIVGSEDGEEEELLESGVPDEVDDFMKCSVVEAINLSQKREIQDASPLKRKRTAKITKKSYSPEPILPNNQSSSFPYQSHIPLDVRLLQSLQFAGQNNHNPHFPASFGSFLQQLPDSCNDSIVSDEQMMLHGVDDQSRDDDQPPRWFGAFMAEFRKHEHRKLQQISDLCAEVRRTNDIEQQRNVILGEKNEILRHLNDLMMHK